MERYDAARRLGGLWWVAAGLAFQAVLAFRQVIPGTTTLVVGGSVIILAATTVLAAPRRWVRAAGWLTAVLLGLDLLGAVSDRFGVLGGPADPGVSWGSWVAFFDYTQRLLPGIGRPLVVGIAVVASVVEVVLGVSLIVGRERRWTGKATAGLLGMYLVSMGLTVGGSEVARYAVPVLVGGALLVSATPAREAESAGGRPRRSRRPRSQTTVVRRTPR